MKDIENVDHNYNSKKKIQKTNKNFSLLTCKKDEFKDWFDPL